MPAALSSSVGRTRFSTGALGLVVGLSTPAGRMKVGWLDFDPAFPVFVELPLEEANATCVTFDPTFRTSSFRGFRSAFFSSLGGVLVVMVEAR